MTKDFEWPNWDNLGYKIFFGWRSPITKTCPECRKSTKKNGEPTLSPGGFLDQIIICPCGWCTVDSIALTPAEIGEFQVWEARPKQLRMEI